MNVCASHIESARGSVYVCHISLSTIIPGSFSDLTGPRLSLCLSHIFVYNHSSLIHGCALRGTQLEAGPQVVLLINLEFANQTIRQQAKS